TGLPLLISTGLCDEQEVAAMVAAVERGGATALALLHCTSEYPAPPHESNLKAISNLSRTFGCPVGFSDHTADGLTATWAVAAGACIIEKHFTLSRTLKGPDHAASLEPAELKDLVKAVRAVTNAMGDGIKRVMPSERHNKRLMQKSIVARRAIAK